ncbi:superoxide dismutase family protein [Fulvivirga sediminis]|uniref:Superoxide dismutase family protein n=1 Tax=Fulvivirga sediminis TaxID=2803949 RepID=A0A937JX75_9BACT|nr:superoxide dismutase family protein [Fulvivirga sediminis]MBL3655223.1 superoxide dismutase family protein [Fulvivirga sediminis]
MKIINFAFTLLLGSVLMVSCGPSKSNEDATDTDSTDVAEENTSVSSGEKVMMQAKAVINPASDSKVSGEATFTDLGEGNVTFKLTVNHAVPGEHAVHLHETGDCSAPDAKSAGGHWNPSDVEHGKRPVDMQFHAGDIDNMEVGEDSTGVLTMTIVGWSIGGADSTNIVGKALIIHGGADDFESQPSGAAGKRVACGVIEKVE